MHTYIICIGSNYNGKENLFHARKKLTVLFPDIRYGSEQETKPFLLNNTAMFINQVARFQTAMNMETVRCRLKEIEKEAGRKPEDKQQEKVILDIDIIICDQTVLKEQDMARNYIIEGIKEITGRTVKKNIL